MFLHPTAYCEILSAGRRWQQSSQWEISSSHDQIPFNKQVYYSSLYMFHQCWSQTVRSVPDTPFTSHLVSPYLLPLPPSLSLCVWWCEWKQVYAGVTAEPCQLQPLHNNQDLSPCLCHIIASARSVCITGHFACIYLGILLWPGTIFPLSCSVPSDLTLVPALCSLVFCPMSHQLWTPPALYSAPGPADPTSIYPRSSPTISVPDSQLPVPLSCTTYLHSPCLSINPLFTSSPSPCLSLCWSSLAPPRLTQTSLTFGFWSCRTCWCCSVSHLHLISSGANMQFVKVEPVFYIECKISALS